MRIPYAAALTLVLAACGPRPDAELLARIDHRFPTSGGRVLRSLTHSTVGGEKVVCGVAAPTRSGDGEAIPFIYRSGCLFTAANLAPTTYDRWRARFCAPAS